MAGLHWKGKPSAARAALYTPKFSRNPRTCAGSACKSHGLSKRIEISNNANSGSQQIIAEIYPGQVEA